MKPLPLVLLIFMLSSCAKKLSKEDLHYLNGYWEIEKVVFPQGDSKEYELNTTVDFFELDGTKGYRKKVQPKPDGGYITSNDAEPFTILETEGTFFIHYKNALSEWQEQIETLSADNFSIVNDKNIRYYYRRFQPIKLE